MSTVTLSQSVSTLPTMEIARFCSTRTHSTPRSKSILSTFMRPGVYHMIKRWKEAKDGLCKACLHELHFRRHPISGQKMLTVLCLHICNVFAKKRGIAKKFILTIRAIMIGQQVDLVAGDFKGTAWRSSSRGNVSTIEDAFLDCHLPTPPGPTTSWDLGPIPILLAGVCGFLKPSGSDGHRKVRKHGASLSQAKPSVYAHQISGAIMKHGYTWTSSIGIGSSRVTKHLTNVFN